MDFPKYDRSETGVFIHDTIIHNEMVISLTFYVCNVIIYTQFNRFRKESIMETKTSTGKKILKAILRIILVILLLIVLALAASFVNNKIARKKDLELIKSSGYYNPVSAGSFDLNTYVYGSNDAEHTFVALPGLGENTYSIDIKAVAEQLSDNCRVIALDTPGYGASDDTNMEMTVENIVNSYRTALNNMGEDGPYILLPHSIGGVYATYWLNKYPDEIEGSVFLDGTFFGVEKQTDQLPGKDMVLMERTIMTLGLHRFLHKQLGMIDFAAAPDDLRQTAKAMSFYNGFSAATGSEVMHIYDNLTNTWSMMTPNDIPKLYILAQIDNMDDFVVYQNFMDDLYNSAGADVHTDDMDAAFQEYLSNFNDEMNAGRKEYIEKLGSCEIADIPGAHMIYLQKPDEVAEAINSWLANYYD